MYKTIARVAAIATGSLLLAGTVAIATATPRSQGAGPRPMSFAALEQKAIAMGIRPTELKIGYRTAEIDGRDRDGREVEIKLDPRSGEVLRRKFDD